MFGAAEAFIGGGLSGWNTAKVSNFRYATRENSLSLSLARSQILIRPQLTNLTDFAASTQTYVLAGQQLQLGLVGLERSGGDFDEQNVLGCEDVQLRPLDLGCVPRDRHGRNVLERRRVP